MVADFVHGIGSVKLDNGEQWTARLADPDAVIARDARVVVTGVFGATVEVAAASDPSERTSEK